MPDEEKTDLLEKSSEDESLDEKEGTEEEKDEQPGALEGLPKKNEPPAESERWNKVYRRMKEAERKAEESSKKLQENNEIVKEMRQHIFSLSEAIAKGKEKDEDQDDFKEVDENLKDMHNTLMDCREKIRAARKEGDWDKVDSLEDRADEIHRHINSLISKKNSLISAKNAKKEESPQKEDKKSIIKEWAKTEAPWFDPMSEEYNPLMRTTAMDIDDALADDPKWDKKPLKERLIEIKKLTEERQKYKPSSKGRPSSLEGNDASRLRSDTANEVKLSEIEKKTAHALLPNVPSAEAEKQYSLQKKFISSRTQRRA